MSEYEEGYYVEKEWFLTLDEAIDYASVLSKKDGLNHWITRYNDGDRRYERVMFVKGKYLW